jgi:hypothetical protein
LTKEKKYIKYFQGATRMTNKLYSEIETILKRVDFNEIWQDFSFSVFALYNQETVYLKGKTIPWDERFLGSTIINFEGSYIAIWNLDFLNTEDVEYLAADMVHEMFHVFQLQNGETRFADELELLAYPDDLDNYQLKIAETEQLIKAFSENNIAALKQFIDIRNARKRLIGDLIHLEYIVETCEGMAEYAGLVSLKQINPEKYKIRLADHISKLQNQKDLLFAPRRMAYLSGAILCTALESLNIDFYHELTEKRPLFELIKNNSDGFVTDYERHIENKKNTFNNFEKTHSEIIKCDDFICGYDPMNMVRFGNQILCSHFVMMGDKFIKGPVMLNLKSGTTNEVESYIT